MRIPLIRQPIVPSLLRLSAVLILDVYAASASALSGANGENNSSARADAITPKPSATMSAQNFLHNPECSFLEFFAPGRRAGFHVGRIMMRAQRVVDLLNATPPDAITAGNAARCICVEMGFGNALRSARMLVMGSAVSRRVVARRLLSSGVIDASGKVMTIAARLQLALSEPTADLPSVRQEAASLLSAAEDLRRSAEAFEDPSHGP